MSFWNFINLWNLVKHRDIPNEVYSYRHHGKAKVAIDCTVDERAYIKMLASRAHMNLSEFVLNLISERIFLKRSLTKQPLTLCKKVRKEKA